MSSGRIRIVGSYGPPPEDDSDDFSDYDDDYHCESGEPVNCSTSSRPTDGGHANGLDRKPLKTSKYSVAADGNCRHFVMCSVCFADRSRRA